MIDADTIYAAYAAIFYLFLFVFSLIFIGSLLNHA